MVQRMLRNKRTFVEDGRLELLHRLASHARPPHVQSVLEWRVSWVAFALTALSGGLVLVDTGLADGPRR